jgi:tryptophan synthase beta chain
MHLLGAKVIPVGSGTRTLKDATNQAIRDWVASSADTHYIIGSAVGPQPYPQIVRDFQSVIGREARAQCIVQTGALPAAVIACVGGGSNAIGMFSEFLLDMNVQLFGAEAAGCGLTSGRHSAALTAGRPGVLHGSLSYLLQDGHGQVLQAHSVSAGLDYPGVGPEHSFLADVGRAEYRAVSDAQALRSFAALARLEGIIPALESSHALALAEDLAPQFSGQTMLICLSGRGDKDLDLALAEMDRLDGEAAA